MCYSEVFLLSWVGLIRRGGIEWCTGKSIPLSENGKHHYKAGRIYSTGIGNVTQRVRNVPFSSAAGDASREDAIIYTTSSLPSTEAANSRANPAKAHIPRWDLQSPYMCGRFGQLRTSNDVFLMGKQGIRRAIKQHYTASNGFSKTPLAIDLKKGRSYH